MDDDDPQKRIAELERQLAEQKRIAELERQIADAKAAANRNRADARPSFFDAQSVGGQGTDDRARQFAESLWEGLRTGAPAGPGGPSGPEMAQHREAFMRAAAQAGLSQEQIDNIFKHGKATTFRVGHSVVYSGQRGAPESSEVPVSGPAWRRNPASRNRSARDAKPPKAASGLGACAGAPTASGRSSAPSEFASAAPPR